MVFVGTTTPLNKADHAASPACGLLVSFAPTFTESWPRVALSLNAVEKRSNNCRSSAGDELYASFAFKSPVQFAQVVVFGSTDFKSTVCHGVPRCTRPSQPTVGNLFVGKSQLSDK